jgi:hypothetical protein
MATCLVDLSILIFAIFKPRRTFSSSNEAREWMKANFGEGEQDFLTWYSQYQVDHWGSIYFVRPTQFWVRKRKDEELSVDRIGMIARPLIEKKLIAEIRPSKQLLTLAQQVLQQKDWTVSIGDAPATVYKVIGNGLAQLYSVAMGDLPGYRRRSPFSLSSRQSIASKSSGDRGPGQ